MGQVSSSVSFGSPFCVDPHRLAVLKFECLSDETGFGIPKQQISVKYDQLSENCEAQRPEMKPLGYTCDPETQKLLLQTEYAPLLILSFQLAVGKQPDDAKICFVTAQSLPELQSQLDTPCGWVTVNVDTANSSQTESISSGSTRVSSTPQKHTVEFKHPTNTIPGKPLYFAFFAESNPRSPLAGGSIWIMEPSLALNPSLHNPNSPTMSPKVSPNSPQGPTSAAPTIVPRSVSAQSAQSTLGSIAGPPLLNEDDKSNGNISANPLSGAPSSGNPSSGAPSSGAQPGSAQPGGTQSGGVPGGAKLPYGVPMTPNKGFAGSAPRPGPDMVFEPEDGPLFRTSIASMERQIAPLKTRVKFLLKRSISVHDQLQHLIEADQLFSQSIQDCARSEIPSLKPLVEWYSQKHEGGMSAIQRQRKFTLNELATRIIEPLQQFFEFDIKPFEQRKRQFEEFSSEFYSWTSRYLSNRKENRKSRTGEAKFAQKKRAFDASRHEYFSYLTEICAGLKQQILLQLFALAAQTITDSHIALGSEMDTRTRPRIDAAVEDIKSAAREWENYRVETLNVRRQLNTSNPEVAEALKNSNDGLYGFNETSTPKNYKEGLLWASKFPLNVHDGPSNKQSTLPNSKWHKYWVVVDGSSLREYTNWKHSVDLHNEPINLLLASVREATGSDRRFSFEVVTPNYKRVYQATSEEDMKSWIYTINSSKTSLLEGNPEDQSKTNAAKGAMPTSTSANTISSAMATGPATATSVAQTKAQPDSNDLQRQTTPPFPPPPTSSSSQPQHNSLHPTMQPDAHIVQGTAQPSNSGIPSPGPASAQAILPPTTSPRSPTQSPPSSPPPSHFRPTILNKQGGSNRIESLTRKLSIKNDRPGVAPIVTSLGANANNNNHQPLASPLQSAGPNTGFILQSNDELINRIYRSPSNRVCAECKTNKGVEWVSINLLMIICIDCSGAHRSLGSHISKVRSLTLDVGAFTPSLRAAFDEVNNESMNEIWEARLPPNRKITPDASNKARAKFVTEKYVEKQYISELEKPNSVLRRAISERDIPKICTAIASRANPNGVSDDDEPMIILALRSALPDETTFPAAEVLIKNGAHPPPMGVYGGLSEVAQAYLASKQSQP